jgi:simple sugar transport system ATP-binding protein
MQLKDPVVMKGIMKRFPGVVAVNGVDFDLREGEIHALIGENGAGKTTLMNVLYGLYQPDGGEIYIYGDKVSFSSPRDAIKLGIGMIHQHFMLIPSLTVVENVILGYEGVREVEPLPLNKSAKKIRELSERYGLKVDPQAKIWQLSVGEQQRVEILKALYRNARILILDEPTSVLTPEEVERLASTLRTLTKEGVSIIFITHKIKEALKVSDRITVLRRGQVTGTLTTNEADEEAISHLMIGKRLGKISTIKGERKDKVLELKGIHALNDKGLLALKDVSLEVMGGEILGIAGVSGNGQRELAEVVMGLRTPLKGDVVVDGVRVNGYSTGKVRRLGVGYIPEDRKNSGVVLNFTVAENIILGDEENPFISRNGFLNYNFIDKRAREAIYYYNIVTDSPWRSAKTLSGGNLQKLIVAREFSRRLKLLVASHPTMGLDIAATHYIREKLQEKKKDGVGILLISEDLDELLMLSDRIAVMYEGKIMGVVDPKKTDVREIGLMMAGVTPS